jgi:hypothetical protein
MPVSIQPGAPPALSCGFLTGKTELSQIMAKEDMASGS